MGDFRDIFEAYGADYQQTMERFTHNEQTYLRFLAMLFRDDNLSELSAALQAGDLTSAFEAAHTLKGVVGNMGLTPLYQAVCAIVEPLRAGEQRDYTVLYQEIAAGFTRAQQLWEELREGTEA